MEMSQAERQVMRVLWAHPGSRSQEIIQLLEGDFAWKAATIKTLLNRLKEKQLLDMVKKSDGKFHYYPLLAEEEQVQKEGRDWLSKICARKRGAHLADLIQATNLSQKDLQVLQALLLEKLEKAPDSLACDCKPGQCNCH